MDSTVMVLILISHPCTWWWRVVSDRWTCVKRPLCIPPLVTRRILRRYGRERYEAEGPAATPSTHREGFAGVGIHSMYTFPARTFEGRILVMLRREAFSFLESFWKWDTLSVSFFRKEGYPLSVPLSERGIPSQWLSFFRKEDTPPQWGSFFRIADTPP